MILNRRGEVFAIRDPRGYRPLCLGYHQKSHTYIAASESCALTAVDAEFVRDIEPGEMVRLGGPKRGLESFRFAPRTESAYCSFEYTYFAHPSSRVNGVSVYEARKRVGKILAKKHRMKGNVVIPVPDSARPAGARLLGRERDPHGRGADEGPVPEEGQHAGASSSRGRAAARRSSRG